MASIVTGLKSYTTILWSLVLSCGVASAQRGPTAKEGDRAPAFSITTEQGKRISPGAFGGKLLVLNFWETSCIPCMKELPSLSAFERKFQSDGVVILAIGADEDAQDYARFLRDHRVRLQTYRDPDRRISRSFGTYMFPETYVIQNGRIIRKVVGGTDWMNDEISSFVRAHLAKSF